MGTEGGVQKAAVVIGVTGGIGGATAQALCATAGRCARCTAIRTGRETVAGPGPVEWVRGDAMHAPT